MMQFIANTDEIALVELNQPTNNEVSISLDSIVIGYFDADEKEFVVYQDVLKKEFGLTVSVEDAQV